VLGCRSTTSATAGRCVPTDEFLKLGDRALLTTADTVSHQAAVDQAQREYDPFARARAELPSPVESGRAIRQIRGGHAEHVPG
jgi:hypothetical protein